MHINHILMSSLLAKGCKFEPILTLIAFQALNNEGPLWYGPSVYKIAPWTHDIHTCWRARCWNRNFFYVAARIQMSDLPQAWRALNQLCSGVYYEYIFFESHFSRKDANINTPNTLNSPQTCRKWWRPWFYYQMVTCIF